jgi:hypothetical protein
MKGHNRAEFNWNLFAVNVAEQDEEQEVEPDTLFTQHDFLEEEEEVKSVKSSRLSQLSAPS